MKTKCDPASGFRAAVFNCAPSATQRGQICFSCNVIPNMRSLLCHIQSESNPERREENSFNEPEEHLSPGSY